ncbi:MAG TPA: tRNA pseudouridine(55) synthase TruB [Pyrinomonadaceae bacterium]|nr:tRNA pseudouridine(55) synthase TruB [Pyrinomonadaceae bacterium]
MDGFLIIDKPEGFTSHDVVAKVRKILGIKRVGHTGTLDPFATGVLVIMVGRATRLAQFLDKDRKSYQALMRLGFSTDTGDKTGTRKEEVKKVEVSPEDLKEVMGRFIGESNQTPPMYSAKKIEGKKLYELARQGVEIERKPVRVKISQLKPVSHENGEIFSYNEEGTTDVLFVVTCSAGTYIRVLAEDIAKDLGTSAHLVELRRTSAGAFDLAQAITLDHLAEMKEKGGLGRVLLPLETAVPNMHEIILSPEDTGQILHGKQIVVLERFKEGQQVKLLDARRRMIAIAAYEAATKKLQPQIVFVNAGE